MQIKSVPNLGTDFYVALSPAYAGGLPEGEPFGMHHFLRSQTSISPSPRLAQV